jgi:hypothetical protein
MLKYAPSRYGNKTTNVFTNEVIEDVIKIVISQNQIGV